MSRALNDDTVAMKFRLLPTSFVGALGFALLLNASISGAQPSLMTGAEEEVTPDGLHRVDTSLMDSAWVSPDLDLAHYTSLFFTPAIVTFREDAPQRADAYSASNNAVFFISNAEQNRLLRIFGGTFFEDLSDVEFFEVKREVGRNVLMIRALLIDVVSGVQPLAPGSASSTVDPVWEGALVLELRDSLSNDVLARTSEVVRAEGPVDLDALWIRTEQEVERWSGILYRRLQELRQLYQE